MMVTTTRSTTNTRSIMEVRHHHHQLIEVPLPYEPSVSSRGCFKRDIFLGIDCDLQALPLRYDRPGTSFVRVVKRRTTANKKERRRTQSINTAFSDLRECIPNVPPDTKLSKVINTTMITLFCR